MGAIQDEGSQGTERVLRQQTQGFATCRICIESLKGSRTKENQQINEIY